MQFPKTLRKLVFQPGKSLDSLLAAVAVVIQQLLPDVDVAPGEEDEARRVVHHDLLHLAVGRKAARLLEAGGQVSQPTLRSSMSVESCH